MKIDGTNCYDPDADPLCDGHTPKQIAELIIRMNDRSGDTPGPRTPAEQ